MRLVKPTTLEEAKNYACDYTTRRMTREELEKRLQSSRESLCNPLPDELAAYHREQVDSLNEWLSSPDFAEGNYHQSIDELLFELVEWRAMFYALQTVDTAGDPFSAHAFFQQWKVGGAYLL